MAKGLGQGYPQRKTRSRRSAGAGSAKLDLLQFPYRILWALNSAVECHPHTVEVVGSNPTAPTISLPFGKAAIFFDCARGLCLCFPGAKPPSSRQADTTQKILEARVGAQKVPIPGYAEMDQGRFPLLAGFLRAIS